MLDRERILAKLDEIDGYLRELREVAPASLADYRRVEKKRSCERLLQIAIECVIDVGNLFVSGLRLGLPAEEDDIFEKLEQAGIISPAMVAVLPRAPYIPFGVENRRRRNTAARHPADAHRARGAVRAAG